MPEAMGSIVEIDAVVFTYIIISFINEYMTCLPSETEDTGSSP